MLAQLQERPRSTTVFRWRCASAADANRVVPPSPDRQELLNAHIVLPAVREVVFIQETLTCAEVKVGQAYVSRVVTEANSAVMADSVLAAVDDEAVQVLIAPAEDELK